VTYYKDFAPTSWQQQIIIGTILGGSSIVKTKNTINCYLSMRGKNPKWLQCKAQELQYLSAQNPYHAEGKYYRWHSRCSPVFSEFREMFYKDGKKKINIDILNELRNIGLSVWFMDVGTLKDNKIIMKTRSLGKGGDIIAKQYFTEIDLNVEIVGNKLQFDEKSTEKFIKVVGDFIPKFM
jgi:hypothetical protein